MTRRGGGGGGKQNFVQRGRSGASDGLREGVKEEAEADKDDLLRT